MLSVTIAIFGVLIGLLCGLLTRLAGSIGLLFLLFLLSVVGDGDFGAEKIYFWILAGSVLSHSMPYSITQRLLDRILGMRLRRISRKHQQQPHQDRTDLDNNSPEDFWDGIQAPSQAIPSAQQTPSLQQKPETEKTDIPLDQNFWDVVENATNKQSSDTDDKGSSDKAEADA